MRKGDIWKLKAPKVGHSFSLSCSDLFTSLKYVTGETSINWDLIRQVWRIDEPSASRERLVDWSVNFSCTKMPFVVWPSLKYVLFWICRIFMQGGSQWRKRCSVGLISRTSDFILKDRFGLPFHSLHFGTSKRLMGSSERILCVSSFFCRTKPQFGSAEGSCLYPDWGKYAGRILQLFSGGNPPTTTTTTPISH